MKARRANHECQGGYACKFLDPTLKDMKTYTAEDDSNGMAWWELEAKQRAAQETSALGLAIKYISFQGLRFFSDFQQLFQQLSV
jgi:hypothetical protein